MVCAGLGACFGVVGGAHALKKGPYQGAAGRKRPTAGAGDACRGDRTDVERSAGESHAQILLMRRSVESSAENLRQNRNFYKAGTAPLTDLLDRRDALHAEPQQPHFGLRSYRTALAKYMRVTGR